MEELIGYVKELGLPGWVLITVVLLLVLDRVGVLKWLGEGWGRLAGRAGEVIIEERKVTREATLEEKKDAREHAQKQDMLRLEAAIQDRSVERTIYTTYTEELGAMLREDHAYIRDRLTKDVSEMIAKENWQTRQIDRLEILLTQLNVNLVKLTDEVMAGRVWVGRVRRRSPRRRGVPRIGQRESKEEQGSRGAGGGEERER